MAKLKMFCVKTTTQPPAVVRVYAVSDTQAKALFRDTFIHCEEATALQIEEMVKTNVPVIGKPVTPDPNQQSLIGGMTWTLEN